MYEGEIIYATDSFFSSQRWSDVIGSTIVGYTIYKGVYSGESEYKNHYPSEVSIAFSLSSGEEMWIAYQLHGDAAFDITLEFADTVVINHEQTLSVLHRLTS